MAKEPGVGFQGEHGAYSEAAVLARFPDARPVPLEHLDDVFRELAAGSIAHAVAPIENSQAGSINRTYDLLRRFDVYIAGEVLVAVDHCLLALPGQQLSDIERVRSHPSALAQCETFLETHGYEAIAHHDTAGAARMIAQGERKGEAALASQRAGELYELEVLARDVQTIKENWTRFVVLDRDPAPRTDGAQKTSLVLATEHRPGALYDALGAFASRGVNLVKLESRPSRGRPWEYVFYLDLEGHREDENVREALAEVAKDAQMMRVLGSYERAIEPPG